MDDARRKRITGKVKWFNAKNGFGFITRHDTGEDIFVHQSSIQKPNRRHCTKSVGDGEEVEFRIVASNVTGPGFRPVKGSPFAASSSRAYRTKGRSTESSRKENSEKDQSKVTLRDVQKRRPESRTKRRSMDDYRKEIPEITQPKVAPGGTRKDCSSFKINERAMINGPKGESEHQSDELEKRTKRLTIKSESNAIENKIQHVKSSLDECSNAESAALISTEAVEQ